MKLIVVCALALLGLTQAANHPTECGDLQKLAVKHQWTHAYDFGEHREELDEDIYAEILDKHPEWREKYFQRVRGEDIHSPEFRAHMARVVGALDMSISILTEDEVFHSAIEHIGHQHYEMQIPEKDFDVFRSALMHAVEKRLGHCFNYDAWHLCVGTIIDGIKAVIHADAAAAAAAA